jgi:hypothetical protein
MKIMNVSLTIDVCNPQQTEALKQLMDALAGTPATVQPATTSKKIVVEEEESVEDAEAKAKADRKARAQKRKEKEAEEAKALAEAEEAEEEEEDFLGETEEEEEEEEVKIDVAMLRTMTAEKSTKFRAEIKAQLTKYGVANVTSIPESKYADYYKFLTGL